jgi:LacI family transcriptional regulator
VADQTHCLYMKNVSIKDIAGEVGVSTTTVSFVLNGKAREKRISEDLKDRILEVASKLNYRPNQVARGLRTGQTHTLGLMVEDISNPFFARLAKVIEDEADRAGYRVIFCSTENREDKAIALLTMLKHRQMDGFIITPTQGLEHDIHDMAAEGRPLVLVDRYFPGLSTSWVTIDNYGGARKGVELMLDKGVQFPALVTLHSTLLPVVERRRGYEDALRAKGLANNPGRVLQLNFPGDQDRLAERITQFLKERPETDGIFFTTNFLGVGGLEAIRNLGLNIPENIRVLCFDDNDLFRIGRPSVTVIAQPVDKMAEAAVRKLVNMLQTKDCTPTQLTLDPDIILRESI